MTHKYTYEELRQRMDEAAKIIELGAHYRHNKSGGEYYTVDFVIIEATVEMAVTYSPIADRSLIFVRPVDDFIETVEINGQKTPRFSRIK